MQTFGHRIRPINRVHVEAFLQQVRVGGNEMRVGSMTVTIHPDDLPNNGRLEDVMDVVNGRNIIHQGVRVFIVDGHHRHVVFGELRKDPDPAFDWTREPMEVFVTMRADGTAMNSSEMMKNSKLLNTASSNALPCVDFLDVLRAVIAYAPTFNECYTGNFQEARLLDIRSDLESANFIPGAKATVYNRYIRLARLCIRHEGLLDLIVELNNRPPIRPNSTTYKLSLKNLTDGHIEQLDEHDLFVCVEGAWFALNAQNPKPPLKRLQFAPVPFYTFAVDVIEQLRGFLATVNNRCQDLRRLLETDVRPTVDSPDGSCHVDESVPWVRGPQSEAGQGSRGKEKSAACSSSHREAETVLLPRREIRVDFEGDDWGQCRGQ